MIKQIKLSIAASIFIGSNLLAISMPNIDTPRNMEMENDQTLMMGIDRSFVKKRISLPQTEKYNRDVQIVELKKDPKYYKNRLESSGTKGEQTCLQS